MLQWVHPSCATHVRQSNPASCAEEPRWTDRPVHPRLLCKPAAHPALGAWPCCSLPAARPAACSVPAHVVPGSDGVCEKLPKVSRADLLFPLCDGWTDLNASPRLAACVGHCESPPAIEDPCLRMPCDKRHRRKGCHLPTACDAAGASQSARFRCMTCYPTAIAAIHGLLDPRYRQSASEFSHPALSSRPEIGGCQRQVG